MYYGFDQNNSFFRFSRMFNKQKRTKNRFYFDIRTCVWKSRVRSSNFFILKSNMNMVTVCFQFNIQLHKYIPLIQTWKDMLQMDIKQKPN